MQAETTTDLPGIEVRMLRWMLILGLAGTVVMAAAGRFNAAMAFAVGAALGSLNFHWLWRTGNVLMAAQAAKVPGKTLALLIARYPLGLAALALIYCSGWFPLLPVIAGMLVPGVGALLESLFLARAGWERKQTV
jgi:hypothetical protein